MEELALSHCLWTQTLWTPILTCFHFNKDSCLVYLVLRSNLFSCSFHLGDHSSLPANHWESCTLYSTGASHRSKSRKHIFSESSPSYNILFIHPTWCSAVGQMYGCSELSWMLHITTTNDVTAIYVLCPLRNRMIMRPEAPSCMYYLIYLPFMCWNTSTCNIFQEHNI